MTSDLISYMKAIGAEELRRDSSGVKPCFDLLEYTLHIDLPGFVIEDPAIKALKQTCDDFVAWANVRVHSSRHFIR